MSHKILIIIFALTGWLCAFSLTLVQNFQADYQAAYPAEYLKK